MKRVITFDAPERNQKRWELLYQSIIIGGNSPTGPRGIEVLRREARVLDALEAVSTPDARADAAPMCGEPARLVKADEQVVFDQADFALLKQRLEEAPWLPKAARDVVDTVDWLSAAPEQRD